MSLLRHFRLWSICAFFFWLTIGIHNRNDFAHLNLGPQVPLHHLQIHTLQFHSSRCFASRSYKILAKCKRKHWISKTPELTELGQKERAFQRPLEPAKALSAGDELTRVAHVMQKLARVTMHSAAGGAPLIREGEVEGCREISKGSGHAWPKCVDKFLDLQWRQKAPKESLVLAESAGKLLTQINE